jgi:hypothetical protein
MRNQLQKTIAELVLSRELLKDNLDNIIKEVRAENGYATNFKKLHDLIEATQDIDKVTDTIKTLIKIEKAL